jgi:hypothetical protein
VQAEAKLRLLLLLLLLLLLHPAQNRQKLIQLS